MIGQVFLARYLIEQRIGSGGMSDVYRGLDLNTERRVAVKILKEEFATDEEFLRRFHREAQAAAALSHENIVAVYDLGHEDGIDFIVMEYVNGETLKEKINRMGALPIETVLRYGVDLCSAVEHAHEAHIIHRDIKPQNIIINEHGEVKLTDFGIARATTSMTVTLTDGSVMGSVHYFSPEQARGDVAAEPSDLYSLGIVLFEMATGRVPFLGDSPVTLALQHLQEPPADPASINPLVPPALSKIILKALKKDIKDRYQSAAEMKADLERVMDEPEGGYVTERVIHPDDPTRRVPIVKPPDLPAQTEGKEEEPRSYEPDATSRRGHRKGSPVGPVLVLLLIIAACVALVGIGVRALSILTDEQLPLVPKVTELTLERAQELLREYEFVPSVEYDYSDAVGEGLVMAQSPEADTQLRTHSVVAITVSMGPEYIAVPGVVGENRDAASDMVKAHSLIPEIVTVGDSDKPRGEVVKQEPVAGFMAENGDTVILYVSDPPLMRKVPGLYGMTLQEAAGAIGDAGLLLGEVRDQMTSEVEPGLVIRQSPEANTEAVEGSEIDVYLSARLEELYSKTIEVDLPLQPGSYYISIDIQDESGKVRSLFSKEADVAEGAQFEQTLALEERAGSYTITVYVNSAEYEQWTVRFGEE